jgi:hypothetical protein
MERRESGERRAREDEKRTKTDEKRANGVPTAPRFLPPAAIPHGKVFRIWFFGSFRRESNFME